jgi:hypothetical protein
MAFKAQKAFMLVELRALLVFRINDESEGSSAIAKGFRCSIGEERRA